MTHSVAADPITVGDFRITIEPAPPRAPTSPTVAGRRRGGRPATYR
ncbi:hypothetical protein [Micromonospora humida]